MLQGATAMNEIVREVSATAATPYTTPAPSTFLKPSGSYRHGDLRNALIAAAGQLVAERDGANFTMRELAAMTGVRHAAVYRHYASKEALLDEIAVRAQADLNACLAERLAGTAPDKAMKALMDAYLEFACAHPGPYRLASRAFPGGDGPDNALRQTIKRAADATGAPVLMAWAQLHGLALFALSGKAEPASLTAL
jgi:AcrR family transcriptional regulator